jgi:hypothetical protein
MGVLRRRGRGDFFLVLVDESFLVRGAGVFLRTVRLADGTFFLVRDGFFIFLRADKKQGSDFDSSYGKIQLLLTRR